MTDASNFPVTPNPQPADTPQFTVPTAPPDAPPSSPPVVTPASKFNVGDKVIVRHVEAAGSGKEPHDREGVVIEVQGGGMYRVDIGGIGVLYQQHDVRSGGT